MKIILIVIVSLIAVFVLLYAYYGGFKRLDIKITEQGGETVVYENITGDYRQSGVIADKIYYSLLNEHKIPTYKGYGKYFDDPKKVEKEKLRSEAGDIIEKDDLDKLLLIEGKYEIKVLPKQKYIITEFPYKGKISVLISIMKVYPALGKYAEQNNLGDGAVIEICDVPNKKLMYRREIAEF